MARARGRRGFGQITQLPSKRYRARYTGPDTALHNAPTTYLRKEDAEAWLVDERRLISEGRWTPPAQRKADLIAAAVAAAKPVLTVGEYVERVIQRRSTRSRKPIAPTTSDTYRKDWRLRSGPLNDLPLTDLTPAIVANWWDSLPATSLTSNGRCYDLLKSVMTEAVEDELIDRNPCRVRGAGKPAPRRQGQALTINETLAYLEAVPARYRLPLTIPAWCGLRSGEVRGLRRCDVDLQEQTIWVRQGVTRVRKDDHSFEWRIAGPKTQAGHRRVALPSFLVDPMRTWLATTPMTGATGLIFPATDGVSPMPESCLWEAHAKGKRAIGRSELTIHDLRRTAATLAAQGGATTAELMRLLGHTTVNMAMVYQVASDDRDRDRARRLDEQIRTAAQGAIADVG